MMRAWRSVLPRMLAILAGVSLAAPAIAEGSELVTATNSTIAWRFSDNPNAVDGMPARYNDCAVRIPHTYTFECNTEFFYTRPDGTPGTRWFPVQGIVQWVGVHPNPFGAGEIGTPKSLSYGAGSSWVRQWHAESPRCLHGWRIHGVIQSNFPCAAYEIWHGTNTEGYAVGEPGFPWLYNYPCFRSGAWTTCQNALGDAYRYHGAYPTVWNAGSGSVGAEVAHRCSNHAGRLEGDGQYSDGAIDTAVGLTCSAALALVKPRYPSLFGSGSTLFGPGRDPFKQSFLVGRYNCYLTPDGPVDLAICVRKPRRFAFI